MKKVYRLNSIALTVIALATPFAFAHAETPAIDQTASATTSVHAQAPAPIAPVIDQSLSARKATAKSELNKTQIQYTLFANRTHALIDRLTAKNFDTFQPQAELTASLASLDLAKSNLALFSAIAVSDDPTNEAIVTTKLNTSIAQIQLNLIDARTHLIASIASLKAIITPTVVAQ